MSLEAVRLRDGSVVMLEPKKAVEVRTRIRQQDEWSRTVSRECRQSNPGLYGSGLKGRTLGQVSGSNYAKPDNKPVVQITTPQEWRAYKAQERKTTIESRWKSITV